MRRRLTQWLLAGRNRVSNALIVNTSVCAGLYWAVEGTGPIKSLWWAIVSGSTVGYGDQYPDTTPGRAIACYLIISSIYLVSLLTGQMAAEADENAWTHEEQEEVKKKLVSIEAELIALREELKEKP